MQDATLTIGQIARQVKRPIHAVDYAIRAYGIQERRRVGILRLWSPDDVPAIESALRRIAERRGQYGR
jgi:hypothetical protein